MLYLFITYCCISNNYQNTQIPFLTLRKIYMYTQYIFSFVTWIFYLTLYFFCKELDGERIHYLLFTLHSFLELMADMYCPFELYWREEKFVSRFQELCHELQLLDRLEQEYQHRLKEDGSNAARRGNLQLGLWQISFDSHIMAL